MNQFLRAICLLLPSIALPLGITACSSENNASHSSDAVTAAKPLVVYSSRKEYLIKPLFDRYTKLTGQPIQYTTDKAGALIQRLKAEGAQSPADLLFTVDAGNLWFAASQGLFAKTESAALNKSIPAHLRDPDGQWFGLSMRARSVAYHSERVQADELSSYEDLAEPKWQGRLCLRTSKKVYNQSLVAMLIDRHGEEKTSKIIKGWVANLAQPPYGSDTEALKAVLAGVCDVTIVNSYYLGRILRDKPNEPLAFHWPDANTGGVHVNVSGAGVIKHAPNQAKAVALLEWLAGDEAQRLFASMNLEYPVRQEIPADALVAGWGKFDASQQNLARAGELQSTAVRLMDRAGYR